MKKVKILVEIEKLERELKWVDSGIKEVKGKLREFKGVRVVLYDYSI